MNTPSTSDAVKLLNEFGVTIHEILRYGYGGFLALALAGWYEPVRVKSAVEAVGVLITTLAAIGTGAALYTLSRHFFCPIIVMIAETIYGWSLWVGKAIEGTSDETQYKILWLLWRILYPVSRIEHPRLYWLQSLLTTIPWLLTATTDTKYHYLKREFYNYGLNGIARCEDAWRAIWWHSRNYDNKADGENSLWSKRLQDIFYRQHSEIHALYVTSLVVLSFYIWKHSLFLIVAGIIIATIAGISDILVSRQECIVLKENRASLRQILLNADLINEDAS